MGDHCLVLRTNLQANFLLIQVRPYRDKNKKSKSIVRFRLSVVPLAGLEPARMLLRGILSPLRLPIPPQRHRLKENSAPELMQSFLEAPPGFEPGDKGFADLGLTTWL